MTSLAEQALYAFLRAHDKIYQATNGRIGHRLPGAPPSLLLHTVGAKTGQPRTTSLSYARDGDDYLVVASKGGDPKSPGWYHNLKANPNVEINVGPKRFPVKARPPRARQSRISAGQQ
jgi:F420H(2)-dependent quinone reductase